MKGKKKDEMYKQEEEEKEEAGEEEEAEEEEEKSKSESEEIEEDDLEKSLAQLEALATEGDASSRKDQLLEKAKNGALEKSEQDELYQLLGGEPKGEEFLGEEVLKGFEENDDLVKALDVSDFLQEQHTELTKALGTLADYIEKGENRQHQFNLVLAKAVSETGRLAKSMAERLGVIEQQPARAPKAKRSAAQAMEKSFAGQDGGNEDAKLSKSEILDGLEDMIAKSVREGRGGATEDGIDLAVAASKFEQFNQIHPSVLNRVKMHLRGEKTVH